MYVHYDLHVGTLNRGSETNSAFLVWPQGDSGGGDFHEGVRSFRPSDNPAVRAVLEALLNQILRQTSAMWLVISLWLHKDDANGHGKYGCAKWLLITHC